MTEWNTFSLFQSLLDEFPERLAEAALLPSDNPEDTYPIKLAIVGFSRFSPLDEWSFSQYQIIQNRLNGDLANMKWFEGCAEAVKMFSCLCLGAMLGKYIEGVIDDAGFLLGDAHLAGFNVLNDETICLLWRNSEKPNVP